MRVLIEYTPAIMQSAGIGRYTRNLVDALLRIDLDDAFTLFSAESPSKARGYPTGVGSERARMVTGRLNHRRMTILWHRLRAPLPIQLFAGRADVLHAPDFSLPPSIGSRAVVTIHDLAFMTHPECAVPTLRAYLQRVVPRAVARADHIIAVSQATANDLTKLLDIDPRKITVIHLGVDPSMSRVEDTARLNAAIERYELHQPFVLAVGTIEPRKNYARLIEAFSSAHAKPDGPAQLVIAGRNGWLYDDVYAAVGRYGVRDAVRFLDFVPEDDLPTLYSLASALSMPSLTEGFGIPIIEAMACGVPVVASDGGSLPEVVGEAGMLVAPSDTEGLAEALAQVVSDASLRERLAAAGYEHVRQFDWDEAARQHMAVYHSVARQ